MDQEVGYDAYLQIQTSGACLALLYDLPGCFARGLGEHAALERLTENIGPYFAWLQRHDDYTPIVSGPFRVQIRERQQTTAGDVYANRAFFTPDGEPVSDEDLDWLLALLTWAYDDLGVLATRQASAPNNADAASQTPSHWLTPLMTTQQWLFAMLSESPMAMVSAQPAEVFSIWLSQDLPEQIQAFRVASMAVRAAVSERDGNRWSLRKVLIRSIVLARDYYTIGVTLTQ